MTTATLHETVLASKIRANQLRKEISEYQTQKNLAVYSQSDTQSLLSAEKSSIRDYFKNLYNEDECLQEEYLDYTEIPDFEEEIDRVTAQFQDELDELTAWETHLDAQITTASAELEEVNAYQTSFKTMLQNGIQEEFDYGLN